MTADKKHRTITLTDRPPVRIVESEWPIIAEAYDNSWDDEAGRYQQALDRGECDEYSIRVRQHKDGRAIVYAIFTAATFTTEPGHDAKAGFVSPSGGASSAWIVQSIHKVADLTGIPLRVASACIADLPAEEI